MNKKSSIRQILVLLSSLAFYLALFFMDGVLVSNDTVSYVQFTHGREPLYPLFLALFRFIFGENSYFTVIVFIQCILAAFSVYRLTAVIDERFHLDRLSICAIPFFQYAVVLLCRFAAVRKATYCNEICSEGLAIPLFTLFMTEVLQYVWYKKKKNLIIGMLLGVCLILVRKQMYIVIAIMFVVFMFMLIARQIRLKNFMWCLLAIAGTVFLSIGVDLLYNLCLRGEAMRHTTDSSAMVITTIYSSVKDDSVYFTDKGVQQLYSDIMEEVEDKQYSYKFAEGNWLDKYEHYANHYDLIAFEVVNPHFYEYLDANFTLTENEREKAFDELNSIMLKTLLPKNFTQIVKVTISNMLTGVCNTISKAWSLLIWYNVLFVVIYLVLMVRCMYLHKNQSLAWLCITILVATVINVGAVGLMIFAQTRYMIYNMPFVYIAMYLMIRDFGQDMWKKKKHLS